MEPKPNGLISIEKIFEGTGFIPPAPLDKSKINKICEKYQSWRVADSADKEYINRLGAIGLMTWKNSLKDGTLYAKSLYASFELRV